tara:strand:- start:153 stop:3095 length:2943 start_codon:yes stop_codon:yes gene_type:complete
MSSNIRDRRLFNNGGFPTMGPQAQMPDPANIQMSGNLPQANNIMAPSGILASSTELSNAVGDQALAQSFAPTANMNSGGIASFEEGGFGSRFGDFLSGTARAGANFLGIGSGDSTSMNPERELYNKTLQDKSPDQRTKEYMENYEDSLPQVKSTVNNTTSLGISDYGGNIGIPSSSLDSRAFNMDIQGLSGPIQTGSWLDENSSMTSERIFPSRDRSFAAGSRNVAPEVWSELDELVNAKAPRSNIRAAFENTVGFIATGAKSQRGGLDRIAMQVYDVLTGDSEEDAFFNPNTWGQVLAVADMVKQQPNYSQDITQIAKEIRKNNPDINSQDLIEQVSVGLKTNYEGQDPSLKPLYATRDANLYDDQQGQLATTTLAESIEASKNPAQFEEIEDIINMKVDQSDPFNQTSAMPPQSLIEEAYKRWANTGFSNDFITDVLIDENRPPEFINAVVNMRGEESEEGAGVPPTEQDGSPNLGTKVFRKDITSYAVGSEGKKLTKEEKEKEKEKVKVIDAQSGGDPDLNIAGSNKEELEAINKNLIEIDKRNKKGGQSQAVLEEDLGTTLATDIIKNDSEETTTAAFEKYAKLFKDSMGPYQGKSEYAKGMDLVALGAQIAGGTSPNAMTNIANGITKTIDRFTEDDDARQKYNNQVRLSGGKFALTRMMKIEDEDRARDKTGQTLSQVAKDGKITTKFFTMNQIINGDSKGWTNDALTVSKLTYMGAVAKAANDLIPEPLSFTDSTKAQEKGTKAYVDYTTAVKGRLIAMNALSMIHDDKKANEIFGWRGVANQLKQKGKAFFNIKDKDGNLDLTSKENKELYVGELTNYLTQYFQNLIPLSLGKAQSANSISNRDVEFLARAYMESGALTGGIFSFSTVSRNLLSQKLRAGLDQFVISERDSLSSFATTYNRLQGLQQTNKTPATELLDQYTVINPKTGNRDMRTKEDDELLVEAMRKAEKVSAPFLQFDSETNTYYDPRTRQ